MLLFCVVHVVTGLIQGRPSPLSARQQPPRNSDASCLPLLLISFLPIPVFSLFVFLYSLFPFPTVSFLLSFPFPFPSLKVDFLNPTRGLRECCKLASGCGAEPQPKSNLVHFGLKYDI